MSENSPSSELKAEVLAVAQAAALKAGELIRARRTSKAVAVSLKAARNLVTTTDLEAEKLIIEQIRKSFPEHRILAEESSDGVKPEAYSRGPLWVIDPIDGTTNFAHGHLQVGVSIGWIHDGKAEAGVVLSPFQDELFSASTGSGAFCNGSPITVTSTSRFEDALIATGFPYDRSRVDTVCNRLKRVLVDCRDVRRSGAASLDFCWVACGRLDGFYEQGLSPWDGVAGKVIVREAGGVIGHFPYEVDQVLSNAAYTGDLFMDNVIAATPGIYEGLLHRVSGVS
jgi:myo-inositol-1(or 4)-monophosphatase